MSASRSVLILLNAGLALALIGCTTPPAASPSSPPAASPSSPPATSPSSPPSTGVQRTPSPPASAALPTPIYFIASELRQIVRLEADGVTITQITFQDEPVQDFAVAPDSGTLVYTAGDPLGEVTLYALDGAGWRALISGRIVEPTLSPDGQQVVYRLEDPPPGLIIGQEQSPTGVWSSPLIGMRPSLVRADAPSDGVYDPDAPAWTYTPVGWSPDGSHLALFAYDIDGPAIPGGELLIVAADGSNELRAGSCCEEERWSADGAALHVAGGGPGPDLRYGIYRIDAASGTETPVLAQTPDGASTPLVSAPQQLADGQLYAFVELAPADQVNFEYPYRPALSRIAPDGSVTPLRPADAPPVEVLWEPGGAGALVTVDVTVAVDGTVNGTLIWLPAGSADPLRLTPRGAQPAWVPAAPLSTGDCASFTPFSYEAADARQPHPEVLDLQRRLNSAGFPAGDADGLYGEQTRAAVRALQAARSITASGDLDCATWQALLR